MRGNALRQTETLTNFTIATNEYRGAGAAERTEYHNIVSWDRLAEITDGLSAYSPPRSTTMARTSLASRSTPSSASSLTAQRTMAKSDVASAFAPGSHDDSGSGPVQ